MCEANSVVIFCSIVSLTVMSSQECYFFILLSLKEKLYPSLFIFYLGPVVQSILSLTSSLRGQLVKCFTTLQPNTLKFFVEKMREAFALQKLITFFQQKILAYLGN